MDSYHPHKNDDQHLLGETAVPLIQGPLTQQEQWDKSERERAEAEKEADAAYKKRQLNLTESNVKLTAANLKITWVLAVFTAIGAIAALYQGHVANKSMKAAEISANAAKSSADTASQTLAEMKTGATDTHTLASQAVTQATQTTNLAGDTENLAQTSKDALISVQRAFVFPNPTTETLYESDGKTPKAMKIIMKWENSGSTPAKNLTIHRNVQYMPRMPDNFSFPDLWSKGLVPTESPLFIAPKGSIGTLPVEVPAAKVIELAGDTTELYFWGWAKYQDVFKGTKGHITRYCYRFVAQPVLNRTKPSEGTLEFSMVSCEKNTCYDDECKMQ